MTNRLIHCILLFCFFVPISSSAGTYKKMFVFGDSLSDTGNLATLSLVSPEAAEFKYLNDKPYQKGFTNGPTAVVELVRLLNVPALTPALYFLNSISGTNFAVAGARAAGNDPIDLNTQVGAFLASQAGNAPGDAFYVLFIGGNDIRDMRDALNIKSVTSILQKATQNIRNNLSLLIASGAKHVMVVNSPDIGNLPETNLLAAKNPSLKRRASLFTQAYNKSLADTVKHIEKHTDVDIVLFDVFTLFNKIVEDNRAMLFSNAKDACFSSVALDYYPICDATQIDAFVFFDEIHPTRRVHERVGRAMFALAPEAN